MLFRNGAFNLFTYFYNQIIELNHPLKKILFALLMTMAFQLMSQVESNFSHFMLKPVSYNVAFAGSRQTMDFGLHYRNQWTGLSGKTISTGSFDVTMPLPKIHSGVALNLMYDKLGVQKNLYVTIGYAYQLQIKKVQLGFGAGGGIIQSTLLGNLLRSPEGDYDNNFDHKDPIIPLDKVSGISPYFSAAMMLTWKQLQIGYSLSNFLEGKAKLANPSNSKNLIFRRNHYVSFAYKFKISKSLNLSPNVLFKTDFKENQLDLNMILDYKSKLDIGLGYRGYNKKSNESVIVLLGVNLWKGLKLYYSYDISTGKLFAYQYGSHEVSLTYKINYRAKVVVPKVIFNPRFL